MQVHLVNRSLRLVTIVAVAAVAVMGTAVTGASASTTAPARTAAHSATAHAVTSPASTPKKNKVVPRAPGGCNNYNLCEYNAGNGGNLCFQTRANENWPGACAGHDEGEYNRGSRAVDMYSQTGYAGCVYLLYSGHYLLYNSKDHFQGPDSLCRGETLEHKLHSSRFV